MIGVILAHYRITAALGAGGMGEVWRATDTKLGREVALKVLPAEFVDDPAAARPLPNAKRGHVGRAQPPPSSRDHLFCRGVRTVVRFLTMQLVEGKTLERMIPEQGLDARDVLCDCDAARRGASPPRTTRT